MKAGAGRRMADMVRRYLRSGAVVEIDGLGTFRPADQSDADQFLFEPDTRPRVFLAYVEEDLPAVRKLYRRLESEGLQPWLDKEKLLPGQNWPRAIERAIEISDFFIACFSRRSETKRGHFHCELRYALECAERMPLEDVYVIPVRLDDCQVPGRIRQKIQYVDLFPDWDRGVQRIMRTLARQSGARARDQLRFTV